MKKFRKNIYDPAHDIWLLEKRVLFFFWIGISAGSERKIDEIVERLNNTNWREYETKTRNQ